MCHIEWIWPLFTVKLAMTWRHTWPNLSPESTRRSIWNDSVNQSESEWCFVLFFFSQTLQSSHKQLESVETLSIVDHSVIQAFIYTIWSCSLLIKWYMFVVQGVWVQRRVCNLKNMPEIKLKHVVSCSSEDHVSRLLNSSKKGLFKHWRPLYNQHTIICTHSVYELNFWFNVSYCGLNESRY